jgi:hypothetical protein
VTISVTKDYIQKFLGHLEHYEFTGFYWKKDPNGDWLLDFCSHIFRKTIFFVAQNPCLLIGNFKNNQIMADFV